VTATSQEIGVRIVEEVPGVPEDERWFISGPGFEYPNHPHFAQLADAKAFCEARGLAFTVENFEP
jgi:hypothetical protein